MHLTGWCLALGLSLLASPSHASNQDDRAVATALFDEAKRMLSAGRYADACPKLEKAQQLWPGIGTLFNLASCYEKVGRQATAWATYREALGKALAAGQGERVRVIRERIRDLEPRLAKLVLEVQSPVPGLVVSRDGVGADAPLWGVAIPVDQGQHRVQARAPGYADWEKVVEVGGRGGTVFVQVPPLTPLGTATLEATSSHLSVTSGSPRPAAGTGDAPLSEGNPSLTPKPQELGPGLTAESHVAPAPRIRPGALAAASVAVVGLGAGIALGVAARSTAASVSTAPVGEGRPTAERAVALAAASNTSYGVAGAAAIAAVILYFVESRR